MSLEQPDPPQCYSEPAQLHDFIAFDLLDQVIQELLHRGMDHEADKLVGVRDYFQSAIPAKMQEYPEPFSGCDCGNCDTKTDIEGQS